MSPPMYRSLLSGRSQQRLVELHRAAATAISELNQHQTLLIGALRAFDAGTQRTMLDEHRARAANAIDALIRLGTFLDHCRVAPDAAEQAQ